MIFDYNFQFNFNGLIFILQKIIECLSMYVEQVGDEGEDRRRGNSAGFLSALRRGHH